MTRTCCARTHVKQVFVRQSDALDLRLNARQRCIEVAPDPVPLLRVPVCQAYVTCVRARHVGGESIVELRRLDSDELVILVLERNCSVAGSGQCPCEQGHRRGRGARNTHFRRSRRQS